jgi:undecaprenyl-diphosphatase
MSYLEAIILGLIQGLTEFLPVSSSGHLELAKAIFGDNSLPEESLTFTVILHFATALSTLVVFRKDIIYILKGLFTSKWNEDKEFTIKIIISMIPAVIIGFKYESQFAEFFTGNIIVVGYLLIITGLLLYLADKAKTTTKKVTYKNAVVIGIAQAIAMLPGISRSGATISTSVLLGNDKAKASRFSFLMVVPLIFGKILKDIINGEISYESQNFTILSVGFLAAFISGLFACTWMITLVKKSKLSYFAIYCFIVGFLTILFTYSD